LARLQLETKTRAAPVRGKTANRQFSAVNRVAAARRSDTAAAKCAVADP